jgi:hypothetical protein
VCVCVSVLVCVCMCVLVWKSASECACVFVLWLRGRSGVRLLVAGSLALNKTERLCIISDLVFSRSGTERHASGIHVG